MYSRTRYMSTSGQLTHFSVVDTTLLVMFALVLGGTDVWILATTITEYRSLDTRTSHISMAVGTILAYWLHNKPTNTPNANIRKLEFESKRTAI